MPIAQNEIILKVLSLMGNKITGDNVLLVEQYIQPALKSICKQVAGEKPLGHERIFQQVVVPWYLMVNRLEYPSLDTTNNGLVTYLPVMTDRFAEVIYTDVNGDTFTIEPCGSLTALRQADRHHVAYYFIDEPYVYFSIPSDVQSSVDLITITYYPYIPLSRFPNELEDLLLNELVKLLTPIQQKDAKST